MKPRFAHPIPVAKPVLPDMGNYYQTLLEAYRNETLTNHGVLHSRLEQTLTARLGAQDLLLCANGTLALMVALCSLPLSGEVITTPFTFPATVHAITLSGLTPVFADVDAETGNLLPTEAQRAITSKTSAILPVHVYGAPCDVDAFAQLAQAHSLYLVYDAAHAFGVQINATPIVRYGHASALSFHAAQMFHTAEGGAVCFNVPEAAAYARLFRNSGIKDKEHADIVGLNAKMSELQAAMGLAVLECLEAQWRARMKHIHAYREMLKDVRGIALSPQSQRITPSAEYFIIRIQPEYGRSRDETVRYLHQNNVFAQKCFYPLVSDCPAYAHLPSTKNLPNARQLAQEALALPLYGSLREEEVEGICDLLRQK